jgi:ribosomal protein S18 acetylase RimI-like enzyme
MAYRETTGDLHEAALNDALKLIQEGKRDELVLDELKPEDLEAISWSGGPTNLRAVARALDRVASGEVEYLVVRAPSGAPVAKVGIDYRAHAEAGTFWQFATHPKWQSLGLGTRLIQEGEARIRRRGLHWAILGVEDDNPQARRLYERLGYAEWRREQAAWQAEDERGALYLYETEVTLLHKELYQASSIPREDQPNQP